MANLILVYTAVNRECTSINFVLDTLALQRFGHGWCNVSVSSKRYHPPGNPRQISRKLPNTGPSGKFFGQIPGGLAPQGPPYFDKCYTFHHFQDLDH